MSNVTSGAVRRGAIALVAALALVLTPLVPAQAAQTFSLSGTVFLGSTDRHAVAGEVTVVLSRVDQIGDIARVDTVASGKYTFTGLAPATYRLYFNYKGTEQFANQYSGNAPSARLAEMITISTESRSGKNIVLPKRATISGTVSLGSTATKASSNVIVRWGLETGAGFTYNSDDEVIVDAQGRYTLSLDPGGYQLRFMSMGDAFQMGTLSGEHPLVGIELGNTNIPNQNITLAPYGSISGRVSLGTSSTRAGAGEVEVKLIRPGYSGGEQTVLTDASGNYTFDHIWDEAFLLEFRHLDGLFQTTQLPATVGPGGRNPKVNVTLRDASAITGHVTLGSGSTAAGAGQVRVTAHGPVVRSALTGAGGDYTIPALPDGSYRVEFTYLGTSHFADAWWGDVLEMERSTWIEVGVDGATADIALPKGGVVSGRITLPNGNPATEASIIATSNRGTVEIDADPQGRWMLDGLYPGTYTIQAYEVSLGQFQYWGSSITDLLTELKVAGGATLPGTDIQFVRGSAVSGKASCSICSGSAITWANPSYRLQAKVGGVWKFAVIDSRYVYVDGRNFSYSSVRPGQYRIVGQYLSEDGTDWGMGTSAPFTVSENKNVSGVTLTMGVPTSTRISGADRFETSSTVSKKGFPDGADVVYVASGMNFPDALGAGPAAAQVDGPLLLVAPTSVPDTVMAEIKRLSPRKIIIVGGTGSVSASVEKTLRSVPSLTGGVVRLSGPDRYSTSIKIARYAFSDGAKVAFLATGTNFPDALTAGPAAASLDAPVILVPGSSAQVDSATAELLRDLGVETVYIVGGAAAISDGFASSVDALAGVEVERLGGDDRYQTGVRVNGRGFFTATSVYLAVGTNYPDALSGGALAGSQSAALFVVPSDCTPEKVIVGIMNQGPQSITLLGGTKSLAAPATLFRTC